MAVNRKDEILSIGEARQTVYDPNTLSWVAMVQPSTGGAAASTATSSTQVSVSNFPVQSTQVSVSGYVAPSTTVTVSGYVAPSTVVTVSGYVAPSTTVAVSNFPAASTVVTVSGYVAPSTTVAVSNFPAASTQVAVSNFPAQSTQVSIGNTPTVNVTGYSTQVTVANFSTQVTLGTSPSVKQLDSTGGGIIGSTKALNLGANGLVVRQGSVDSTTFSGQAAGAGDNTIGSSAAGTGLYVYAYAISPLSTAAQLVRFLNGSTSECWRVKVLGGSTVGWSGTYSQMAVAPPAYLFRTAASNPLVLNVTSSGVNYSVSAWRE